jgi:sorbose reductase
MTDIMRSLQVKEPNLVEQFEKETLFGRIGFPDDLNGAILFLCTQTRGWYTGQDLLVDGSASTWKHPASFSS